MEFTDGLGMKITVNGAEFKAFYNDEGVWSQDGKPAWYVEDMLLSVKGADPNQDPHDLYGEALERLPDDAEVVVSGGWLVWQGQGSPPRGKDQDLVKILTHWKAHRKTLFLTATFEIDHTDLARIAQLQEWLLSQGAKVSRSDGQPVEPRSPAGAGKGPTP